MKFRSGIAAWKRAGTPDAIIQIELVRAITGTKHAIISVSHANHKSKNYFSKSRFGALKFWIIASENENWEKVRITDKINTWVEE